MRPISPIVKGICILMFLLIALLNVISIATYWRNVHNEWDESVVANSTTKEKPYNSKPSDIIFLKLGIIKNCKTPDGGECIMPDGFGFVGDTAIFVMLSVALAICIINILVTIASSLCRTPKLLYLLPLTSFLATALMIASIVIFVLYRNIWYFPRDGENFDSVPDYKIDGDYISGPFPLKITFAEGFYITIVNTIFSLLTICAVGFAAYKSVKDANEAEAVNPPQLLSSSEST